MLSYLGDTKKVLSVYNLDGNTGLLELLKTILKLESYY